MDSPDIGALDSLFGKDDEDDKVAAESTSANQRPAENGVLQFHAGTEEMLWLHVQRANPSTRSELLSAVDKFCYQRHWMMHCGPQKGQVLEQFLLEHVQLHPRPLDGATYRIVEFGTYCGYSLIRMANALLSQGIQNFHIHTIDIVEPKVARRMVRHVVQQEAKTKPEWKVTFLTRSTDPNSSIQDLVDFPIDFLFLDHDKDAYLPDLQLLEAAQCIRAGTAVAADNVVVFGLDAYRSHVASHPCVTATRLVEHALEYAESEAERYPDGMELSVYTKDPF